MTIAAACSALLIVLTLLSFEKLDTPLSKDNALYRYIRPRLKKINLGWVDFQVMRRTYASLMREALIQNHSSGGAWRTIRIFWKVTSRTRTSIHSWIWNGLSLEQTTEVARCLDAAGKPSASHS